MVIHSYCWDRGEEWSDGKERRIGLGRGQLASEENQVDAFFVSVQVRRRFWDQESRTYMMKEIATVNDALKQKIRKQDEGIGEYIRNVDICRADSLWQCQKVRCFLKRTNDTAAWRIEALAVICMYLYLDVL